MTSEGTFQSGIVWCTVRPLTLVANLRHVDSPAKRLERIAGEYNHMLYLIDKAGELPFVQSLNPVSRIRDTWRR